MSVPYDDYLVQHKANVKKGFDWIKGNLPDLVKGDTDYERQIGMEHDLSKSDPEEYGAYDAYFYGKNRSHSVVSNFKFAWLRHIRLNPHHWQHWVLIHDEPNEAVEALDMPYNYILEMICDWWAFSWQKGNLDEVFRWWAEHSPYMKLSAHTRYTIEHILCALKNALLEKGLIQPIKEEK